MDDERWRRLEDLFLRAVPLQGGEREAFLGAAGAGDPDLLRRLREMLAHDGQSADLLGDAVAQAAAGAAEEAARAAGGGAGDGGAGVSPGQRIGTYQVVRELGHGGMGAVHLAVRADDQYRKQVAIKVALGPIPDERLLRRFRAERQILASLEHPNIARLLDGGATDGGWPYVVMEYVEGEPIDAHCDHRRLPIEARLRLFRMVCDAVEHAHRNLVVHHDLKPANILVTPDGAPKLLDFGIARLLDPDPEGAAPALTATATRLLTPEYASPEQIQGGPISTASDVYSLGVMLYELLAGRSPYHLKTRTPAEIERMVTGRLPDRPSTAAIRPAAAERSGREGLDPRAIALARGTEPARLHRRLAGDLDTIVLKALQKDPARRYGSARELSEDIRRHLEGLPVTAQPDSWTYRTGKFARRHAWGVAATVVVAVVLAGSALGLLVQARRLAAERDRALLAERQARTEATTLGEVSDFLVRLFEVSDPATARGRDVRVREILDQGARRIRTGLTGQPEVRARLLATMSEVYANLGLHEDALPLAEETLRQRREVFGPEHPEVARAMVALGHLRDTRGEYDDAERELTAALEMRRRLLGPDHRDIVESLTALGNTRASRGRLDEAVALHREALEMARRVPIGDDPLVATCLENLGTALNLKGDYADAEKAHRESLEIRTRLLGEDHPDTVSSVNRMGQILIGLRRYEEAEQAERRFVELRRRLYGEESPDYAIALTNLAAVLKMRGRPAEAESLQREAMALLRRVYGDEHPLVLLGMNNLANLLQDQGDLAGAEALHRKSLALNRKVLGSDHPAIGDCLNNLANVLRERGKYPEAARTARAALALDLKLLGPGHPYIAMDTKSVAMILRDDGRLEEAEDLFRQAIDLGRKAGGQDHPDVAVYQGEYAVLMMRAGRLDEAERLLREALATAEAKLPAGHYQIDFTRSLLGECLTRRGRLDEAEPLLTASYISLRSSLGEAAGNTRRARARVVELYAAMGTPAKALP